jgi:hypothetical protein
MGIIDRQSIEEIASGFQSKRLFYPCAGKDIVDPIKTFLPFIDEFWFIDLNRFDVKELLAEQEIEFLQHDRSEITGYYLRDKNEPFRLRNDCFVCRHIPTDSQFTINYCCGPRSGYNAFRAVVKDPGNPLSVFYYRGDSPGEGGSGFRWTDRKMLRYVLAEIEPGGMLVTDGSMAHPGLSTFCGQSSEHKPNTLEEARAIVNASPAFDYRSWHLECIAYLGHRYGPTLAWRVDRKNAEATR